MESFGVGSIKKIFGRQREPYGFLTIHHPEELRGDEAVFYLKDVIVVNEEERRLLQGGMMVKFMFTRKPLDRMKAPCPFKAIQVRPQDPMKYSGTVAKSSNGNLVVFLDILFRQVRVQQVNQAVDAGDKCAVSITWDEMVRSTKENRDPVGTLIGIEKKYNSFFSQKNPYEDSCKRCQHDYYSGHRGYTGPAASLNYNNPAHHQSMYQGRSGMQPQTMFGTNQNPTPDYSLLSSIWSEDPIQSKAPSSRRSDQHMTTTSQISNYIDYDSGYSDVEWYLRTIRMAEMVLSGSNSGKK